MKVTSVDLAHFEMPVSEGDIETVTGLLESAKRVMPRFVKHDGFFM